MVNIDDFIKRLEIILDYYGLNASAFADKIGVQRSSLSHLLSGRNKPSLDFILKILEEFPEVDLYWMLNGKGQFPKSNKNSLASEDNLKAIPQPHSPSTVEEVLPQNDLFSDTKKSEIINPEVRNDASHHNTNTEYFSSELEKIVFFYKDGTFKTYSPQ